MLSVLSEALLYRQLLLRMSAEDEEETGTGLAAGDVIIIVTIIVLK
jgi:hypothetical protein